MLKLQSSEAELSRMILSSMAVSWKVVTPNACAMPFEIEKPWPPVGSLILLNALTAAC